MNNLKFIILFVIIATFLSLPQTHAAPSLMGGLSHLGDLAEGTAKTVGRHGDDLGKAGKAASKGKNFHSGVEHLGDLANKPRAPKPKVFKSGLEHLGDLPEPKPFKSGLEHLGDIAEPPRQLKMPKGLYGQTKEKLMKTFGTNKKILTKQWNKLSNTEKKVAAALGFVVVASATDAAISGMDDKQETKAAGEGIEANGLSDEDLKALQDYNEYLKQYGSESDEDGNASLGTQEDYFGSDERENDDETLSNGDDDSFGGRSNHNNINKSKNGRKLPNREKKSQPEDDEFSEWTLVDDETSF